MYMVFWEDDQIHMRVALSCFLDQLDNMVESVLELVGSPHFE